MDDIWTLTRSKRAEGKPREAYALASALSAVLRTRVGNRRKWFGRFASTCAVPKSSKSGKLSGEAGDARPSTHCIPRIPRPTDLAGSERSNRDLPRICGVV